MRTVQPPADRDESHVGNSWAAVYETFAKVAADAPTSTALVWRGERLTYAELRGAAMARAVALCAAGVGPGDYVALVSELCLSGVVDALAAFAVGAAYVPIEPSMGGARIAAILADAGVAAVLSSPDAALLVRELGLTGLDDPDVHKFAAVESAPADPHQVAYVIYTSGSTGQPKGVVVEHGNLAAMTKARREVYPGAPIFLVVSPLAFDSSAAGIWGTLTAGGTLVIADMDDVRDPDRLLDLIASHGVTHVLSIPALYHLMLRAAARRDDDPLRSLEVAIVAGEALSEAVVNAHFATYRHRVELVNEYGPTETTVWASYHRFTGPGPVAIGIAVPGVALYVINDEGEPAAPGVPGELHIGGAGVARGYLGHPDATAAAFLPDPFVGCDARMYRTGDRVRRRLDGTLEFLGRLDHQVKIRGRRIELEEVEVAVRSAAPEIDSIVVVLDSAGALKAYFEASHPVDVSAVLALVRADVGDTATPSALTRLDTLPRTFAGKIDRVSLAGWPIQDAVAARRPSLAGNDDLMAAVTRAWRMVLGRDDVPTDVGFLDAGGHSLAIFELQDALEAETGLRPRIVDLYRHVSVADQAALLTPHDGSELTSSPASAVGHASSGRRHRLTRGPQ